MCILNETQISTDVVVTECNTGKTSLPLICQRLCEHDLTRLNGLTIIGILVMVLGQNKTAHKTYRAGTLFKTVAQKLLFIWNGNFWNG